MSHGEERIAEILRKAKVSFVQEKTFSDLKHNQYRYDFYIENLNGKRTIIEFNGLQHYKYMQAFYVKPVYWMAALERDRKKISYALANDIDIYLVPFWDYNKLNKLSDLLNPEYHAKNRWHNDDAKEKHKDVLKSCKSH